eukprot:1145786-Pelagomonas_calceolata.AAC.3
MGQRALILTQISFAQDAQMQSLVIKVHIVFSVSLPCPFPEVHCVCGADNPVSAWFMHKQMCTSEASWLYYRFAVSKSRFEVHSSLSSVLFTALRLLSRMTVLGLRMQRKCLRLVTSTDSACQQLMTIKCLDLECRGDAHTGNEYRQRLPTAHENQRILVNEIAKWLDRALSVPAPFSFWIQNSTKQTMLRGSKLLDQTNASKLDEQSTAAYAPPVFCPVAAAPAAGGGWCWCWVGYTGSGWDKKDALGIRVRNNAGIAGFSKLTIVCHSLPGI